MPISLEIFSPTVISQFFLLRIGNNMSLRSVGWLKGATQLSDTHLKECSMLYVVRELQTSTTLHIMTHLLERPKFKTLIALNAGENVQQKELSFIAAGNAKWCSYFWKKSLAVSDKLNLLLP